MIVQNNRFFIFEIGALWVYTWLIVVFEIVPGSVSSRSDMCFAFSRRNQSRQLCTGFRGPVSDPSVAAPEAEPTESVGSCLYCVVLTLFRVINLHLTTCFAFLQIHFPEQGYLLVFQGNFNMELLCSLSSHCFLIQIYSWFLHTDLIHIFHFVLSPCPAWIWLLAGMEGIWPFRVRVTSVRWCWSLSAAELSPGGVLLGQYQKAFHRRQPLML